MKNKIMIAGLNFLANKLQKSMWKYKTHFQIIDVKKLSELQKINVITDIKEQAE